jgi:hypothetical protein
LFGGTVKKDPIPNLRNPDNTITGTNGSDAVFKVFQRGSIGPVLRLGYCHREKNLFLETIRTEDSPLMPVWDGSGILPTFRISVKKRLNSLINTGLVMTGLLLVCLPDSGLDTCLFRNIGA